MPTTYESDIKTLACGEQEAFGLLSDLSRLAAFKDAPGAPKELREAEFDADSCRFRVEGLGTVGLRIIGREPYKTIKFETENIPMLAFNAWIQLKQVAEADTRMKLTLRAELPPMVKMMVDKKLREGINRAADVIAQAVNRREAGRIEN